MMFLHRLLHSFRARAARRRSMGFLLDRPDDHLLRDIGLSRDDLRVMLEQGGNRDPVPERPQARRCCAPNT